jgi:hypothetical protein
VSGRLSGRVAAVTGGAQGTGQTFYADGGLLRAS